MSVIEDQANQIERLENEIVDLNSEVDRLAIRVVPKLEAEIEQLRAALRECSDDLAAYIEHHYAGTLDYPSRKAKYDREMDVVLAARKLLERR